LLVAVNGAACSPHVDDLAPDYQPAQFVVPASWHGASPFVEAQPSDGELRTDWWKLYDDPILDRLEDQAMAANPDLQAAAERFIQARDMTMKARSRPLSKHKI
jgi:outer membrane protein TolC